MRGSCVCGAVLEHRRGRVSAAVCAGLAGLALVSTGKAALVTWSGTDSATNSAWSDGNNWVGSVAPVNNGTVGIVFTLPPNVATPSTVSPAYSIQSLTFTGTAPGYSIGGSPGLTIGSGGITDSSSVTETISSPITLGAAQSWSSAGDLLVSGAIGGTGPLTISGSGVVTLTASNTYLGGTTISSGTLAISNSGGVDAVLGDPSGSVNFSGGTLQVFGPPAGISSRAFNFNAGGGTIETDTSFFIAGSLNGSGTLTKTGDSDLSILGDNGSTFSGAVNLHRGSTTLYTYGDQPLGTGSVTLSGGSSLSLGDQIAGSPGTPTTVTTPLASAGTFTYGSGGGLISPATASADGGSIFITQLGGSTDGSTSNLVRTNRGTLIIAPADGTASTNLGVYEKVIVTGTSGNLPPVNNGIVSPTVVGQNNDGDYTGDFLNYNSSGFVSAVAGYTAGFGGTAAQVSNIAGATSVLTNTSAYSARVNSATVTISPAATLTLGDGTATHAAGLILNGTTPAITGGTLAFGGSEAAIYTAQTATISSAITGSNGLTAFGPGTLTIAGSASYSGATTINGVNQPNVGPMGTVLLSSTATMTGGGTVAVNPYATFVVRGSVTGGGAVTVDGTLSGDGSITGPVTVDNLGYIVPGYFSIPTTLSTGNLSLLSGSTAEFGLNSVSSQELNVTGTVALSGATLDVVPPSLVAPGSTFVLIANDGTDPVTGTFNGLPQGATFTASNGIRFAISYTGDSVTHQFSGVGNDVLLQAVTVVPEPASIGALLAGAGMLSMRRKRRIS